MSSSTKSPASDGSRSGARLGSLAAKSGASGPFLVRIGGRGLSFVLAVLLTRLLGVHGYGVYAYAIAWTTLLTVPTSIGLDRLLVQYVATYDAHGSLGLLRGLVRRGREATLGISLTVIIVMGAVVALAMDKTYAATMLLALPLIPLQGLVQVDQSVIQGLRHPELSLVPVYVVAPGALIVLLLTADLAGLDLDSVLAMGLGIAAVAAALTVAILLRRRYLAEMTVAAEAEHDMATWVHGLAPLAFVALVTTASSQIDIIMLGILGDASDVGRFQVTLRVAQLVSLVLAGVNTSLAPRLARFYALGERDRLRAAAVTASQHSLFYSLPVATILLVFHSWFFKIFGSGLSGLGTPLAILIGAELLNAAAGSVGTVLTMTGRGAMAGYAMLAALVLDGILCVALIPPLGLSGAAIASGADLILWNLALTVVVKVQMGFNATAFAVKES
ncbi:MAG: oligosaccharide flippase family protein [Solirubrobacterales bacterium]